MNKFISLIKCEEKRMLRYGITYASLATTVIWIILIQIINADSIDSYFPLFIFIDATLMSFLLVGVGMMFEKQENALKTLLVIPMSKHHYLLSKILATVVSSLITLILLGAYGVLFKNLSINYLGIIGAVILIAFVFASIGVLFTYISKDFTHLLMWVFLFSFALAIPTILQFFGIITADWFTYLQYVNPTSAALTVLMATVHPPENLEFIISLVYLITLAAIAYYFVARFFDKYSVREYGGE